MAHLNRLKARDLDTLTKPGRHADGGGLYLSVASKRSLTTGEREPTGAKSWIFMYQRGKKQTEIGLGSLRDVSLTRARKLAAEARQKLANGEDPKPACSTGGENSFAACAEHLIASLEPSWRSQIHAQQWRDTLTKGAARLAHIPVDKISTEDVLGVLAPLWISKRTTAERLRGRIERVLNSAKARKLIAPPWENPARWRGHLDHILPKRQRVEQRHHAALPYDQVPAFLHRLRAQGGVTRRALEFIILTAARSGEVRGARWSEIDLEAGVWTVPGERMKAGRTHRVPLSTAALAVLRPLHEVRSSEFAFPGLRGQLDRSMLKKVLRSMNVGAATVHGFRSAFRDWAAECTSAPHEVCEAALAHAVGSTTERAYRRTDVFEKRRELMQAWGDYCTTERGKVLAFRR